MPTAKPKTKTPRERFLELAPQRVGKAIKAINLCTNLASESSYQYTPEEVKQLVNALEVSVAQVRDAFAGRKVASTGFQFKK